MNSIIKSIKIDWKKVATNSYLKNIRALNNVFTVDFNKAVTFFVGENGSGKSTLLEAIAVKYGFNPEGGSLNYNFVTYEYQTALCSAIKIIRGVKHTNVGYYLRAESFYNVATKELEYADMKHPAENYHEKSHGESFLAIAQKYFVNTGLYILDEPEAALSPARQLTLLAEINSAVKNGSQFVIISHSPILLGLPDADIYTFDSGKIHLCKYEETSSYQITSLFINNKDQVLNHLLD